MDSGIDGNLPAALDREGMRSQARPPLCAAIVDRITFEAHIIETGTESYRLRATRRHRAKPQSTTRAREGTSS